MKYEINHCCNDNSPSIYITNGLVNISDRNLKIAMLHDFDLILNTIDEKMEEMRNTCTLNTGKIDLPCGFYMINSFFSVAGVSTYIGRHVSNTESGASISHLSLSCIGYEGDNDDGEDVSIKEYGKRLFELKMKLTKHGAMGNFVFTKDEEIDWERCFDESTPDQLYKLFRGMQENFMWGDIDNMIYVHSLFGQAYANAVKRVSEYEESQLAVIKIPESYIVYDEFRKILRKLYFNGFKIRLDLFICYVKDYLNINKKVE